MGHSSINIDATITDGNGTAEGTRNISYNEIFENNLTSPNTAYGGRIVVDDAHDNNIYNNEIINTSVESQLNGYDNNYTNNTFKDTKFTEFFSDHTAVKIESYSFEEIRNNRYIANKIINRENGVGLKIIAENIRANQYIDNTIIGESDNSAVSYYGNNMSVSTFNSSQENDDTIYDNKDENIDDENVLNVSDFVAHEEIKYYTVSVEAGQSVHALLDGLNADADLYVKVDERPNIEDSTNGYDCKSTNGGTSSDSCSISVEDETEVYIGVFGFREAEYTLEAIVTNLEG